MKNLTTSTFIVSAILSHACTKGSLVPEERPILATVSGEPIYLDEFQAEYRLSSLDAGEQADTQGPTAAQKQAILRDMVEQRLVRREAEKLNVVVGLDEVESAYLRISSGWPETEFRNELAQRNLTPAQLKRRIREKEMLRKYFREHIFSRVAVTDAEIEQFLESHPERLIAPETVRARQIVVKGEDEAKNILRDIQRRAISFEDAAMQHSLSPEGKNGGDLGWFSRGSMPKIFDEVCFSLRPGEISKVVASDYGFHIFQMTDKKEEHTRSINDVRDEIEAVLRREKEHAAQNEKLKALRAGATISIKEERFAKIR